MFPGSDGKIRKTKRKHCELLSGKRCMLAVYAAQRNISIQSEDGCEVSWDTKSFCNWRGGGGLNPQGTGARHAPSLMKNSLISTHKSQPQERS